MMMSYSAAASGDADHGGGFLLGTTQGSSHPPSSAGEQEIMNEPRTLLGLLEDRTDGSDGRRRGSASAARWKGIKERLRILSGVGFCVAMPWASANRFTEGDDVVEVQAILPGVETRSSSEPTGSVEGDVGYATQAPPPTSLARALEAERELSPTSPTTGFGGAGVVGSTSDEIGGVSLSVGGSSKPLRVSLMRLLAETMDGESEEIEGSGIDTMCCVCMERKKGAAYIPCGHTFCRVCSREVWLIRGTCCLCNRSIVGTLDIF